MWNRLLYWSFYEMFSVSCGEDEATIQSGMSGVKERSCVKKFP